MFLGFLANATLASGSSPDIPWVRILFVLVLCLALAVATIGFVRLRYGMPFLPDRLAAKIALPNRPVKAKGDLAIVERLSSGPASQFVVLQRGTRKYLLHISQQGVTEIDRFDDEKAAS